MRERRKWARGLIIVLYWDRGMSTKVITILRIHGPLANSVMEKFRVPPHITTFSQKSNANSSDLAFRMNCLVREVFKEVISCLFITEPNWIKGKRSRRRRRRTTTNQVFKRNGLLRFHDKETKREREREREREEEEEEEKRHRITAKGKAQERRKKKDTCNAW